MPLTGYFIVKHYSRDAVNMPRKFFYDSTGQIKVRGKLTPDTTWHQVSNLKFTNHRGEATSLYDLSGKVVVVSFFFTRCPSICPRMTKSMKKLQASFVKNPSIVQFLSISIDPTHDSVPRLRDFADRFGANHDNWWFVSGDKKETYDFAFDELKASIADPGVDTAFIHTENFFLLDSNHVVRGWYNAFDSVKQAELVKAIPTLMLERQRSSPSFFRRYIPYLPAIFLGIGMIILVVTLLNRNKREN